MRIFTPNFAFVQSCSRSILRMRKLTEPHAHAQLCARVNMLTLMLTPNSARMQTCSHSCSRPTLRACNHAHAHAHAQSRAWGNLPRPTPTPNSARANMRIRACSRPTLSACNHAHTHAHALLCARAIMPTLMLTLNPAHGETYRAPRPRQHCARAIMHTRMLTPTLCACKRHQPQRSAAHARHCRPMLVYYDFLPWFPMLPFVLFWQWQRLLLYAPFELVRVSSAGRVPFPPSPPPFLCSRQLCCPPPYLPHRYQRKCATAPICPLAPPIGFPRTSSQHLLAVSHM